MDPSLAAAWKQFMVQLEEKKSLKLQKREPKDKAKASNSKPVEKPKRRASNKKVGSPTKVPKLSAKKSPFANFGALAKTVNYLKNEFLKKNDSPKTMEEIIEGIRQSNISQQTQTWLATEALPNNPKIESSGNGTFRFKPPLKCRNKKSLVRLLKSHDMNGRGGIYRHDIVQSVPDAEKILKTLSPNLIQIKRRDKKTVIFYDDHQADYHVDDDFKELWRSINVEGLDDEKIEEYLHTQRLRPMRGIRRGKTIPIKTRRKYKKKQVTSKDNLHVAKDLMAFEL